MLLKIIIKIIQFLFLFPIIYFVYIIIKSFYLVVGIFPAFIASICIGGILFFLCLAIKQTQIPEKRNFIKKRDIKEEKESNQWGIIDYFDKDK